ncbi:helix-turn-helix transcriptional regulator [Chitinophaga sp.]|uniref:helix-turn-helix domain-containing protein n=1 Tax=Chitinophaga sp. TaxID=1869181 RepID=UPI0025B7B784|nr:helix-turn-helix transcriptional regulator [Chitinophaga sp.]
MRYMRARKGLSTREFADTAGISFSQVWSIESGAGNPTIGTLDAIVKVFNLSLAELLKDI